MPNPLNFAKKLLSPVNIQSIEFLKKFEKKHKIVVYIPENSVTEVIHAMSSAGAGRIGDYTVCSFRVKGKGTFKGGKNTKPVIGTKGKFEIVEEVRLEMVCNKENLQDALDKMLDVHPYEEPAYEIYDIITGSTKAGKNLVKVNLKNSVSFIEILNKLNKKIEISLLHSAELKKRFKTVMIDISDNANKYYPVDNVEGILKLTKSVNGEFNISF